MFDRNTGNFQNSNKQLPDWMYRKIFPFPGRLAYQRNLITFSLWLLYIIFISDIPKPEDDIIEDDDSEDGLEDERPCKISKITWYLTQLDVRTNVLLYRENTFISSTLASTADSYHYD